MSKNAIHQDEERLARERRAVLRLYDAFSRQDPDLIDDAVTPDWEDIPPAPGQGPGPEGMKPIIRSVISAFPDVQIVVHELIQVPGKIAVRGEITGTHEGELFGIAPTGKAVRFRLHEFHALDGERITTTWHMEDWYGLFLQLGRFPAI
ncbi:ester cyclase [uncultured Massilia sp.]|uniref:ester cyclase n=1 Tax=uncultured Massilia sp. TaxID=169973 RepID=UPI0025894C1E|nr:ester cyclase [uncultured Massilia sp.]